MNKLNVMLIALSICSLTTIAAQADRAGGGGDVLRSTTKEVMSELEFNTPQSILRSLDEIRLELKQPVGSIFRIEDPKLRQIFSQMIGTATSADNSPMAFDIKNTKVNVEQTGPCVDVDGEARPMSVKSLNLGSDLCISVPELRKYPVTTFDLSKQIQALYFHEFTHHLGYGEQDAQLVQTFILRKFFGPIYPSTDICSVQLYLNTAGDATYHRIDLYPKDAGWSFGTVHGSSKLLGQSMLVSREEDYCPGCQAQATSDQTSVVLTKTTNKAPNFRSSISKTGSMVKFAIMDHTHKLQKIEVSWGALITNDPWLNASSPASIKAVGRLDGQPVAVSGVAIRATCFYDN